MGSPLETRRLISECYNSTMHKKPNNDLTQLIAIHSVVNFAETLPMETLTLRNREPVYPVTIGENIASYVLRLVLEGKWQNEGDEQAITEIESILSQLDMGVDKPQEWQNLFRANKALGVYLRGHISRPRRRPATH